jgi:hypothetical protein
MIPPSVLLLAVSACLLHHSSYKWSDRPDPECLPRLITAQMLDSEAESGRDHMANQDS